MRNVFKGIDLEAMEDEAMVDDTQQGEWQATTEDSHSPEAPSVGEWRECVDTDPTYLEIAAYCAFRAALWKYISGMWAGHMVRPRLSEDIQRVLDKLEDDKNAYPLATHNRAERFPKICFIITS